MEEEQKDITTSNAGTKAFMAPESWESKKKKKKYIFIYLK